VHVVLDNLDLYLEGARLTVELTLGSFALALVLGTITAAARVSPVPPLRAIGAFYVETVRNTPLLVIFVLFYFGLPKAGVKYSPFASAIIVLGLYTGTFVAETVRSGINAVASGQAEAARSLGLTFPQTLGLVVLPQAFRAVVPALGSVFIASIKNSSVALVIGVHELTFQGDHLAQETAQAIPVYLGVAVAYLLLALPAGWLVSVIQRKVALKR
jgi:glutamate transport system permease protein